MFQVFCYFPRFASVNVQTYTKLYDDNVSYDDVGMTSCITSLHAALWVLASVVAVEVLVTAAPGATAAASTASNNF